MYALFAWRYFKAKKSAHAINLIAWVTTAVIAFATCCQVLVLSVFNGFESLVQSLYSSFYPDIRITAARGKTFELQPEQLAALKARPEVAAASAIVEETALLQNLDQQSMIRLKGVDADYTRVSGVRNKTHTGEFRLGDADSPELVLGSGVQYASGIVIGDAFAREPLTIILPRKQDLRGDPMDALSEGIATASGAFSIQQEFDNSYAITNLGFVRRQMMLSPNTVSAVEIKLKPGISLEQGQAALAGWNGKNAVIQTRYQQNSSLYQTMKLEKWAIYAILTLILIIAAFNMVSALSMLVLEKKQDISILSSMGSTRTQIRNIFLSEGLLLGMIGTGSGLLLGYLLCLLQMRFKLIKLSGGSFVIDHFPVHIIWLDFLLVAATSLSIVLLASWFPARQASRNFTSMGLKGQA